MAMSPTKHRTKGETYQAALQRIVNGQLPCRVCDKAHGYRPGKDKKTPGSWADPDDGHAYAQVSVQEFADRVLKGRWL